MNYSQQALPWFRKYFPVSSDFSDPVDPEIFFFLRKLRTEFYKSWTSKTMGVKYANCTLKKYFVTRTMDKVFFDPKHYRKGKWLNKYYKHRSCTISVSTSRRSHELNLKNVRLKRPPQSFTFEFSNVLAWFSFVFGLSTFGFKNQSVWVICRAGKWPEIMVIC